MDIAIENLPPYEAISCTPICEATAGLDAAKAACLSARRDLIELEQTKEAAEWRDAEAADKARAEGKAEPKRSHVAVHDRKTDEARHEHKVATLAETRARDALQVALDEHGQTWVEEVTGSVEALRIEWQNAIEGLLALHGRFGAELSVARAVVGNKPGVAALGFKPSQIRDIDFAVGTNNRVNTGWIATGEVLAGLADLGTPQPEPEPFQPTPLPRGHGSSLLRGQAGVEDEIAERREFAERARDPERVAERRQLAERLRAENEAARAAEVG
jgi:hypothetical protein